MVKIAQLCGRESAQRSLWALTHSSPDTLDKGLSVAGALRHRGSERVSLEVLADCMSCEAPRHKSRGSGEPPSVLLLCEGSDLTPPPRPNPSPAHHLGGENADLGIWDTLTSGQPAVSIPRSQECL